MKKVAILIGPSGVGKSTLCEEEFPHGVVVSADHHFIDKDGKYNFNVRELGNAHAACLRSFVNLLLNNEEVVVVDNTNTSIGEVAPYISLAQAYGYDVHPIYLKVEGFEKSAQLSRRNRHGVSSPVIHGQLKRCEKMLEEWPPFWPMVSVREVDL